MPMKTGPEIDPFRERQVPDVAGRFLKERDRHQRQADLMWLGTMAAAFSDHELKLLSDLGYLSQHDLDLLRQGGRGVALYIGMTPTLKQRLTSVLEAAGFASYENHLPVHDRGGCFEVVVLAGALVRVQWWDAGEWERRKLLERFAVALEAAGLEVEDRGEALYVAGG